MKHYMPLLLAVWVLLVAMAGALLVQVRALDGQLARVEAVLERIAP